MCQRIELGDGNYAIVCGVRQRRAEIKYPATHEELKAAGYKHLFSRNCRLCDAPLEFWRSPTKGGKVPLEPAIVDNKFVLLLHWVTCPHAAEFRKAKKPKESKQGDLFE